MSRSEGPILFVNVTIIGFVAGKITDVERMTTGGFARGRLIVTGSKNYRGESLQIQFQNENLVAMGSLGTVIASVPDLICCVEVAGNLFALCMIVKTVTSSYTRVKRSTY